MKKCLLFFILGLVSISYASARIVYLSSDEINIGELRQARGASAFERIDFYRTSKTPKKVEVNYSLSVKKLVCTVWDRRWYGSRGENIIASQECFRTTHNEKLCYPRQEDLFLQATYFTTNCVRREYVNVKEEKVLKFRFRRAPELNSTEREVFMVQFDQIERDDDKVKFDTEIVSAYADYKVRFWTFLTKDTLIFRRKGDIDRGQ